MWAAVVLFVIILGLLVYYDTRKPKNFPPGPGWLPILGSALTVHKLRKKTGYLYQATAELAKQYGPVVGLRVGKDRQVVAFSYEAIKEMLSREEFDGRPQGPFYETRTWGIRRGILLTDEEFWHEQRRFVMRHLKELGMGRRMMSDLVEQEAEELVNSFRQRVNGKKEGVIVPMLDVFAVSILNTLWSMMAGIRYSQSDLELKKLQGLLSELFASIDMVGCLFSQFPVLRFLAPEFSGYKQFIYIHQRLWEFLKAELDKHKETFSPEEPRDFMDAYLKMLSSDQRKPSFSGSQYLFLMPYVEAIMLESVRMFMGRTFSIPHRALKDTELQGYHIPKDTMVICNFNGTLMDEKIWEDPFIFRPERFIDANGKLVIPEKYTPFGMGKHRCMGENLAKSNVFLFTASLLQNFSFNIPPGTTPPTTECIDGVTPSPKPYDALVVPRAI
ncbi:putative cytochrome P450 303a1 [Blattella germanica]|nr:putative cytochrome P450 303a1 [Blattella germanica]